MRFRKVKSLINESHVSRWLILEAKEDIQKFVDKFGEENYELFKNSNQRLKNAGLSTDILWYVKNIDKDELEDILSKLQRRLKVDINDYVGNQENNDVKQSSDGIRGEYKYLGEKDGYKVYQPLDYLSSMDLGYMTGWCTTGRHGHAGEKNFKPSSAAAKKHFNNYTRQGVSLYYFLDSKTMEGLYAVALLPKTIRVDKITGNYYIQQANVEIYNQADKLDYSIAYELPLDLIPSKIVLDVTQKKDGLFIKDKILLKAAPSLRKVTIPEGVISIGGGAFQGCNRLASVVIPNSVTTIGGSAFYNCSRLSGNLVIPNSVTSIGKWAFYSCDSLTSITLPENLISIENWTFRACSGLTSVVIPKGVTSIGENAFSACESLTSITIPNSVTTIGDNAFYYCSGLTSVVIPDSVTTIGERAFKNCSGLARVEIPDSVKIIGDAAFGGCEQLVIECHKGSRAEEYAKMNEIPVKYL